MMTLEERKKNRQLMLRKFYELANGQADYNIINLWEVGKALGWDHETTETTYDYLQGEGLLKAMTMGGGATITHEGVKEVEKTKPTPLYERLKYRVRVSGQDTDYPPDLEGLRQARDYYIRVKDAGGKWYEVQRGFDGIVRENPMPER